MLVRPDEMLEMSKRRIRRDKSQISVEIGGQTGPERCEEKSYGSNRTTDPIQKAAQQANNREYAKRGKPKQVVQREQDWNAI
ncbi:hypothetical protein BCON_0230g00020 [Botryotinia convoluta]|uniref:Uncharacterized protein n=1 Tax=Botryotinia convoluta TaxID=54673 RepID=A0A4Z1HI82_9HELO|nr:hypothetical protein BCON_0230g00020 [Botryotinia convoluta]